MHTVIAAMITKLPAYTTWPAEPAHQKTGRATLAVMTSDAATLATFRKRMDGVKFGGLTWKVVSVSSLDEAAGHQFVFLGKDVKKPGSDWYEKRHSEGVLTFGQNAQAGCIFNFLLVDGRLRFDLDMTLAKRAGMSVDSRLLKLARNVRHKP